MVAATTYDETGTAVGLSDTKTTMCSELEFESEESIHGQVLSQSSTLSSQLFRTTRRGRLSRCSIRLRAAPLPDASFPLLALRTSAYVAVDGAKVRAIEASAPTVATPMLPLPLIASDTCTSARW